MHDEIKYRAVAAVRDIFGSLGSLPPELEAVTPTKSNQNASVADVAYGLWAGEVKREDLTERDIVRMEVLGIWVDGQLTIEAQDIFSAAVASAWLSQLAIMRERAAS
jgi:hypothetical protein